MALLHELYGEIGTPVGRKAINYEEKEAYEQRVAEQEALVHKINSSKKAGKGGKPAPISSLNVLSEIDLGTPVSSRLNMNRDGNSVEISYAAQGPSQ